MATLKSLSELASVSEFIAAEKKEGTIVTAATAATKTPRKPRAAAKSEERQRFRATCTAAGCKWVGTPQSSQKNAVREAAGHGSTAHTQVKQVKVKRVVTEQVVEV